MHNELKQQRRGPEQLWGLMDCNNFYASCERLFRPDLQGRPIVVLSNNDGCIVARSAEAKALGIPMGEPEFKARAFLRRHNVAVFSSNYALYGDISQRVMQVTQDIVPHMEQYSIDEAFLQFTAALQCQGAQAAQLLRERVLQWTGIAVSVGLGSTRTLAKLANHLAKKGQKTGQNLGQNTGLGVYAFPQGEAAQDALLAEIAVGDIWGIGRRQAAKLQSFGIYHAKALRDMPDAWLQKHLTVTGLRTALELRGISCIDVDTAPTPRHTLVSSRSFGEKVYAKDHLAEALTTFTVNAAQRLRREGLLAGGISVHIRASKHCASKQGGVGEAPYNVTLPLTFAEPTDDSTLMVRKALQGLDALFKDGVAYAKAGVMLYDLGAALHRQGSLLRSAVQEGDAKRSKQLMQALDGINARYGKHTLHYAAQGLGKGVEAAAQDAQPAPWRMRQKFRSPKFTTTWEDLPAAHCR